MRQLVSSMVRWPPFAERLLEVKVVGQTSRLARSLRSGSPNVRRRVLHDVPPTIKSRIEIEIAQNIEGAD